MNAQELIDTARTLVGGDKGPLAIDDRDRPKDGVNVKMVTGGRMNR